MRSILQINTTDTKGGAARVAWELKAGLTRRGYTAPMIVGYKYSDDPTVRNLYDSPLNRLASKLTGRNISARLHHHLAYWLSTDIAWLPGKKILTLPEFKTADLIHLHNLHTNYFNLHTLPAITRQKPTVWTLHDMWALTGHAPHAFDCPHWPTGGCDCALLNTLPPLRKKNTDQLWRAKQKIYRQSNLHVVVPSRWLDEKVNRSLLADKPRTLIYNGVDINRFRPGDKQKLREQLQLPPDKTLLLFSSKGGAKNPWKGWSHAMKLAGQCKAQSELHLICVGGYHPERYRHENITFINYDEGTAHLTELYGACDILLYPSIADNCPLTILEAMACGLPVLTFATGGIPELVDHQKTGYVAGYRDQTDLGAGLSWLLQLSSTDFERLRNQARQRVVTHFSLDHMIEQYLQLYSRVTA